MHSQPRSIPVILGLAAALLVAACSASGGAPSATPVTAPTSTAVSSAASTARPAPSSGGPASAQPSATAANATPAASAAAGSATAQMAWHEGEPTPNGCLVATAEEVSAASGFEIVRILSNQSQQPGCAYYDKDGLVLSTRFHQRATGEPNFAAEAARPDNVDLPGVGDQAIWIPRVWQVWAWQGDTLVMMGIGRIGETPARLALAKKLGPVIVDRFR